MVMINHEVDEANIGGGGEYPLLPDGDYTATIVGADAKVSQKGDTYLQLQFDLGQSRLWANFNLWHSTSAKAVEIAKQELNNLGAALGMPRIGDSEDLIAKRLTLVVGTEEAKGDWPAKNKVVDYKSLNETSTQPAQQAPQVTTQTETAAPTGVWNS